jgi:hypothetical protein
VAQVDLDCRGRAARLVAGDGVQRVVDEVAHDRHEVERREAGRSQVGILGDVQDDASLLGRGGLAEEQGDERRLADALLQPPQQLLRDRHLLGGELHRLVVAAELDEADERVESVGRLMRLRAQRVGHALDRDELGQRRAQLGSVAQRHDVADAPAVDERRPAADDQHALADEVQLVLRGARAADEVAQRTGRDDVRQPLAQRLRTDADEPLRLVVDQLQPARVVEHEHALADRVQDRVVVLVERRDLARLEAERLPLDAPREQQRQQRPDQQRQCGEREQPRQLVADLGADVLDEHAGGDEADDPPGRRPHRHHRADRLTERAGARLDHRLALRGGAERPHEAPADLVAIGVRVADALRAHHHDERDAGRPARALGQRLQAALGVRPGERGRDLRLVGHGGGDGQRTVALTVAGGLLRGVHGDGRADPDGDEDHRELQEQHLPGEAAADGAHGADVAIRGAGRA